MKTTGNKLSQINSFHRRCSKDWPENIQSRERTKDHGVYELNRLMDRQTDGWMDGWNTYGAFV